jgi:hypothetical protein
MQRVPDLLQIKALPQIKDLQQNQTSAWAAEVPLGSHRSGLSTVKSLLS